MNFQEYKEKSITEKVNYFLKNLSISNREASYYVKWDKIKKQSKEYTNELKKLNQLLGQKNVEEKAEKLFIEDPSVLEAIPILIALRLRTQKVINVMELDGNYNKSFYSINFSNIDLEKIDVYMKFIRDSGLFEFFKNSPINDLRDYIYGVEVGMDTNARKNRSGKVMKDFIQKNIESVCKRLGFKYEFDIKSSQLKKKWNYSINSDKKGRKFNAAILDEKNNELYVIVNDYYGGGGTKPSTVTDGFIELDRSIKKSKDEATFIWITDGLGWNDGVEAFTIAFKKIDYVFNMEMVENDFIYELLK